MSNRFNIAIVGASGAVGEALLDVLEQRDFPVQQLFLLASEKSAGKRRSFKGKSHTIQLVDDFDFSQVQIAFFSAGAAVSETFAPKAADQGCVVIDNTSQFRLDDDVPLIVPEVNPGALADYSKRNIIANPNCSTIQMLVALKPIYDAVGISRVNVATYQAVSGSGDAALKELAKQTADLLNGRSATAQFYPHQIAFNVLPQVDALQDNGYTKEEMKMHWETRKIFADKDIAVNATAVRVPVFYGHSEAVHLETREPIELDKVRALLSKAPGVKVIDDLNKNLYPTPVSHAAQHDEVFVSRIRKDLSCDLGLNLWVVSDNVRKGAALNSVQIAELLVKNFL